MDSDDVKFHLGEEDEAAPPLSIPIPEVNLKGPEYYTNRNLYSTRLSFNDMTNLTFNQLQKELEESLCGTVERRRVSFDASADKASSSSFSRSLPPSACSSAQSSPRMPRRSSVSGLAAKRYANSDQTDDEMIACDTQSAPPSPSASAAKLAWFSFSVKQTEEEKGKQTLLSSLGSKIRAVNESLAHNPVIESMHQRQYKITDDDLNILAPISM